MDTNSTCKYTICAYKLIYVIDHNSITILLNL